MIGGLRKRGLWSGLNGHVQRKRRHSQALAYGCARRISTRQTRRKTENTNFALPPGERPIYSKPVCLATFLDSEAAPKNELKVLYRRRWNVEFDLRNIKTTLGMERLRCKTPEMAIKELWVNLLAYCNMIRLLMAQAALLADQVPRQLSFKHTVQIWLSWQQRGGATQDGISIHALLVLIAEPRVGLRPGRIEPRALKRRTKQFPLMTKPRTEARAEVLEHGHPKKQP